MKTPNEIKHGLECCTSPRSCLALQCEYFGEHPTCITTLARDTLEYINELEMRAPRWISVKDRLPEAGVRVLTIDRYGNIRSGELYVFKLEKIYFSPNGLAPGRDITHWMPLPEVPEEE